MENGRRFASSRLYNMNLISTSQRSGNSVGNYALAGSLFLHAGLIVMFSAWPWSLQTPKKSPPRTIHVKFITAPSTSGTTPKQALLKHAASTPAQPMSVRSAAITLLEPRTPKILNPLNRPLKVVRRATLSSKLNRKSPILPRPVLLKSQAPSSPVRAIDLSASRRKTLHPRAPASIVRMAQRIEAVGQTAMLTEPGKSANPATATQPRSVPPLSIPPSTVGPVPRVTAEHSHANNTVKVRHAALPGYFSNKLPAVDEKDGEDLDLLRGTFTGKVRQRIATAKHYPRIARRRGMEGRPVIVFTLDKQGRLKKADLARTSGYQVLDRAALQAVHNGAPYPEIPAPLKMDSFQFKLPISFVLK